MVRVIEAIYRNPKFSVKEMGKEIVRKETEIGNQARVPTISLLVHNGHDCNYERHKRQAHTRRKGYH